MRHTSVSLGQPCEFIEVSPYNPLISKCKIKVCYVGDTPNRNKTVITKERAIQIANSICGSPIIGYYNEEKGDFEDHGRYLKFDKKGNFTLAAKTRPYGFIDMNAQPWFEFFLDDNEIVREYMVIEGYLWTEMYPECKRVIEIGNNQSLQFHNDTHEGHWVNYDNTQTPFFVIDKGYIEGLCILGEDVEPCFEGSNITNTDFSFNENFLEELKNLSFSLKELLKKEGGKETMQYTSYAAPIGEGIWNTMYGYLQSNYPAAEEDQVSTFSIVGFFNDGNDSSTFAVVKNKAEEIYSRLNFTASADRVDIIREMSDFNIDDISSVHLEYTSEDVENFEKTFLESLDKTDSSEVDENEDIIDTGAESELIEEPVSTEEEPVLEPIEEPAPSEDYTALKNEIESLRSDYEALLRDKASLEKELTSLREFKLNIELKEKQELIDSFYMLSDEDKADVVEHINEYSLSDIEAKLCIICVRNRVSFEDPQATASTKATTYSLNDPAGTDFDETPAWVKAALAYSERNM